MGVANTDIHSIVYKSHQAAQSSTQRADSEPVMEEEDQDVSRNEDGDQDVSRNENGEACE